MKVKSESEVTQSGLTPRDPMDCSPPGSSIHGICQARVLEWGAIAFSDLSLDIVKHFGEKNGLLTLIHICKDILIPFISKKLIPQTNNY